MEYEKKQKIKFIAFVIFIYVFCVFLCLLGVVHYLDDHETKEAIKEGVIVEGEYVKVISRTNGSSKGWVGSRYYVVRYEYINENGIKYEGEVGVFQKREDAESYIGNKVDIYIGSNGHSIPVFQADDFNENFFWWLMGIAIGIAVCFTTGLIIWGVIKHKRKNDDTGENTPSENV